MITVHHLNNSRSQRIIWLLEELGVEYEIKFYQRDSETMLAPKDLEKIHPLGKSPVLQDGDTVIAETGAIVDYLAHNYADSKFAVKRNDSEYLNYNYWMHYSEGSLMSPLLIMLVFEKVKQSPVPFFIKPITRKIANSVIDSFVSPNLTRHFSFIEDHLKAKQWFAADKLSAADVMMIFPLEASKKRGIITQQSHPEIINYIERIHQRPSYQAALDKGGDYDYA